MSIIEFMDSLPESQWRNLNKDKIVMKYAFEMDITPEQAELRIANQLKKLLCGD